MARAEDDVLWIDVVCFKPHSLMHQNFTPTSVKGADQARVFAAVAVRKRNVRKRHLAVAASHDEYRRARKSSFRRPPLALPMYVSTRIRTAAVFLQKILDLRRAVVVAVPCVRGNKRNACRPAADAACRSGKACLHCVQPMNQVSITIT